MEGRRDKSLRRDSGRPASKPASTDVRRVSRTWGWFWTPLVPAATRVRRPPTGAQSQHRRTVYGGGTTLATLPGRGSSEHSPCVQCRDPSRRDDRRTVPTPSPSSPATPPRPSPRPPETHRRFPLETRVWELILVLHGLLRGRTSRSRTTFSFTPYEVSKPPPTPKILGTGGKRSLGTPDPSRRDDRQMVKLRPDTRLGHGAGPRPRQYGGASEDTDPQPPGTPGSSWGRRLGEESLRRPQGTRPGLLLGGGQLVR